MAEGVAGLALGDRAEQGGHVGVALDVGLLGEVEVAAVGLALAGERLLQVGLGLVILQCWHGVPSLSVLVEWTVLSVVHGCRSAGHRPLAAWSRCGAAAGGGRFGTRRTGHGRRPPPQPTSKPRSAPRGTAELGEVGDHVADLAAGAAHQVVVGSLDVGVEAGRAGSDVERGDLAQLGQVVQGLVDGLERDVRHLAADPRVDRLGRRMGDVALRAPKMHCRWAVTFRPCGPEQVGQPRRATS